MAKKKVVYRLACKILDLAGRESYYGGYTTVLFCGYDVRIIGKQILFRRQIIIEFDKEIVFRAESSREILMFCEGSWTDLLKAVYENIPLFIKAECLCHEWQKYECDSESLAVNLKNTLWGNCFEIYYDNEVVYSQDNGLLDCRGGSWMREMQSTISRKKRELSESRDERANMLIEQLKKRI